MMLQQARCQCCIGSRIKWLAAILNIGRLFFCARVKMRKELEELFEHIVKCAKPFIPKSLLFSHRHLWDFHVF